MNCLGGEEGKGFGRMSSELLHLMSRSRKMRPFKRRLRRRRSGLSFGTVRRRMVRRRADGRLGVIIDVPLAFRIDFVDLLHAGYRRVDVGGRGGGGGGWIFVVTGSGGGGG